MTRKVALFAFNGEPMCFLHVLLNAFDMAERGDEVTIILEGSTTRLAKEFHEDSSKPFANLYEKAKEMNLIGAVCRACASKMGALESAQSQGLTLEDDMKGHPSMARYLEAGYQILTF